MLFRSNDTATTEILFSDWSSDVCSSDLLIVPVLGVVQVFNVLLNFFLSDDRSLTNLWDIARYNAITLFWASGNPADGIPSCGMPWFLFALFWGKLIWELLGLLFPKGDFAVSFIVMLFGAYIGQVQYLPQCLGVAMVVVMYLTLGQIGRASCRERV